MYTYIYIYIHTQPQSINLLYIYIYIYTKTCRHTHRLRLKHIAVDIPTKACRNASRQMQRDRQTDITTYTMGDHRISFKDITDGDPPAKAASSWKLQASCLMPVAKEALCSEGQMGVAFAAHDHHDSCFPTLRATSLASTTLPATVWPSAASTMTGAEI